MRAPIRRTRVISAANRANYINPMQLFPAFHDDAAKTIVRGATIAAGPGRAQGSASTTLDALFEHPNTGPFIAAQLIQRLVTSNPSPAYVYRVAQVFANNGAGVRGDLGAVVRAILTDYEARSHRRRRARNFGKLKEPLLRATALLRAFGATASTRALIDNIAGHAVPLAQAALRSPTVFNFYRPDLCAAGRAGLRRPRMRPNIRSHGCHRDQRAEFHPVTSTIRATTNADQLVLICTHEESLAGATPAALLDHLDLVLCGGSAAGGHARPRRDAAHRAPCRRRPLERVRAPCWSSPLPAGAVQK